MTDDIRSASRRAFLRSAAGAIGTSALLTTPGSGALAEHSMPSNLGVLAEPHHAPRANRVICLHMLGAISHVDTFDYKPTLVRMHGEEIPPSIRDSQRISTMSAGQSAFPLVRPLAQFKQRGQSGAWVSDLLPHTAAIADELCIINSMHTEHVNHDPASKFLHTGFQLAGRPAAGAWIDYAYGSANDNLPAFITMRSGAAAGVPLDSTIWGAGFLPSHHQGVEFRADLEPVLYLGNPGGADAADRRALLSALGDLARTEYERSLDADILSRMTQYEMAYRMQSSIPEVADISAEPDHVLDMYGQAVKLPGTFARNCLLARRLAERDVRFITLFSMGWDHHAAIAVGLPSMCADVDRPVAGLVQDLKQRGLLDDTLVMFVSEFGRSPFSQGDIKDANFGRDHHGGAFSVWLAGGGVKAGYTHGESDEFGYNVVRDPLHVHDLNATVMHLLGIDHERLTYFYQGRDFRLTDVHGHVVERLLA